MSKLSECNQNQSCTTESCQSSGNTASSRVVRPHWKLGDDGVNATLSVALPGVEKESLELSTKERIVSLKASRKNLSKTDQEEQTEKLHYELKLRLSPDLDTKASSASLKNGVLNLSFPRKEEAKPRSIPVSE